MIKAICFDFDGTLAQYQGDFEQLGLEVLSSMGLSYEFFPTAFQEFIKLDRSDGGRMVVDVLEHILASLKLPKSNAKSAAELMNKVYSNDMKLLDGAKDTLELVRHLPLAIITNGISDMQRLAIRAVNIENYFKTIIVSADLDVAVRKPNKRIFEIAASRLGFQAQEILMIGNSADDIVGGQKAGFKTISFDERFSGAEYVANHEQLCNLLIAKYL